MDVNETSFNVWRIVQEKSFVTRVFIDDKEVYGVRSLRFQQNPQELPTIYLEILPGSSFFEGMAQIVKNNG